MRTHLVHDVGRGRALRAVPGRRLPRTRLRALPDLAGPREDNRPPEGNRGGHDEGVDGVT